jgi:hypothetical protein
MLPVQTRSLTAESRRLFTTAVQAPVLATAELYGGKLVAALDRQHPRDLFDSRRRNGCVGSHDGKLALEEVAIRGHDICGDDELGPPVDFEPLIH